ncbi:MAG: thioredoxin domain-containing protein [Isosphaeraceae bacterium]
MSHHAPSAQRNANRLAAETSPYLLQHALNPVDWYPWGPEALERARAENKPIFLSIGYSACHWCHVMERESFEDDQIAAQMNEHFINVKVDREERPDLDQIYMTAVQAMTGHGGWPMSVFLTPDLEPFFGGTYFPPHDSRGMAGFDRVLQSVHRAWLDRRDEILSSAREMTAHLQSLSAVRPGRGELTMAILEHAASDLLKAHDRRHGGFGSAPKFPHPMDLRVLMRHHARTGSPEALQAVRLTLDRMAQGGIYDHLGGGFARYSTDERWLVPHFEKMLYDNALLSATYVEAYQLMGEPRYLEVVRETFDYVLGRMTDPAGGFYSTEDADSEGVEGKYYVWSLAEVEALLGPERSRTFAAVYDVSAQGNWEHHNILNLKRPLAEAATALHREPAELAGELRESRAILLAAREQRVPPGKDTKVLTSWNGLMIAALADGAHVLEDPRYLTAAEAAAAFLLYTMVTSEGRLLHCWREGQAKLNGYLDDYANLIDALTRLFEATGTPRWLDAAGRLADTLIAEFSDPDDGGCFYTGLSHETLIARTKDAYDNATPSGNAMAATALLRLGHLLGRNDLIEHAERALRSVQVVMEKAPSAAGQSLLALDFHLARVREYAVVAGDDPAEFRHVLGRLAAQFSPHRVLAPAPASGAASIALLEQRPARNGRVTTYICEGMSCQPPVVGLEALEQTLQGLV